jgi:Uma2 family endonuclease
MTTATEHITTADQLLQAADLGRCELVRGELVMMSPAGAEHGSIIVNITIPLGAYVKQNGLGRTYGAETGFIIHRNPDTVRAPDVSVVRTDRIPGAMPKGFFPGAPDLAVEVVSPDDRASKVSAKVYDWLDAGCLAVWVADPPTRTVTVYRSRAQVAVLGLGDQLTGDDVVPGFSMPVAEVFA